MLATTSAAGSFATPAPSYLNAVKWAYPSQLPHPLRVSRRGEVPGLAY